MKKHLLLAALAVAGASTLNAANDPAKYADFEGFTCENLWLSALYANDGGEAWKAIPIAGPNYARTSTIFGDNVYIATSKANDAEGALIDQGSLIEIDMLTGKYVRTIQLTLDGKPYEGLLCANQVGADQFGHMYVAGYLASTVTGPTEANPDAPVAPKPYNVYTVDPATGALTLAAALSLPEEEVEAAGRIDYCHVVGDITGAEAPAALMCALSGASSPYVLGWVRAQGSDEWEGAFDGYVATPMTETTPADLTDWGTAPTVTICLNDEFTPDMFYVDGFATIPALYSTAGGMVESFNSVDTELWPKTGTNGVAEFTIGGTPFLIYSMEQYDSGATCRARVAKLGEGMAFEGMQSAWVLPEGGLGETSDGGARYHTLMTKVVTDENGKEAALLLTHKGANGMGVYRIAEPGFNGVNDIEADVIDENAPVEYFNVQGVRVNADNLSTGVYVTRQGAKTSKVIVK